VNTGELSLELGKAECRVLEIQTKLHRWAGDDPHRRFDDLFNLVADSAFLLVAWDRMRSNRGARTAGVDGETAHYIEAERGVEEFLADLRADVKARSFQPLAVRQRAIPKAGGKVRYLGIASIDPGAPAQPRVEFSQQGVLTARGCRKVRCAVDMLSPATSTQ
jgi:RNA-directed DNA polymerase